MGHPTPKPFGLYRRAIEHATVTGDVVLDMFAGSGTAILVADGLRRRAVAVEVSPRYCALVLERCGRHGIKFLAAPSEVGRHHEER
ncbi:DNA methyltransferase [Nannocystis pusilla]|uniref:DNA methyltransferase n=1 Tax=Nannocystis pusilla TaxID=889268 RepID=UPI003B799A02